MHMYRITYLDKYEQPQTAELPAEDIHAAIDNLEELLNEQITVDTIEILDETE
jgi:hypothetical protein